MWIKATTNPSAASYQELLDDPAASPNRGLIWIGVISLIFGLTTALVIGLTGIPLLSEYGNVEAGIPILFTICMVPASAALMVLGVALSAAIMNLIARAMGGEGNYAKLVYIVSAFSAPLLLITSLISLIPYIGFASWLISLYMFVLYVHAIKHVYKFSTGKAILAYFIPTIVGCILVACIIAGSIPVFTSMLEGF